MDHDRGYRSDIPKSKKIYISHLDYDVTEDDLKKHFGKYGDIESIDLKKKQTGITFAFILFEDLKDAETAVQQQDCFS